MTDLIAVEITDDSFPAPCERPTDGNAQVMAWHRVCDCLRDFGAVRDDENITHIVATARGLEVFTAKKPKRIPEYLPVKKRAAP